MDRFLTVKEVAGLIRVSVPTVNRLIRDGSIPSYKVGGRRLFDREEIISWVKSHRE